MKSLWIKFSNWWIGIGFFLYIYLCLRDHEAIRFTSLYPYNSKLEHALVFALFSPYIYFDDLFFRTNEDIVCTETPQFLCVKEVISNVYYATELYPNRSSMIRLLSVNMWIVYILYTFKPLKMGWKSFHNWINEYGKEKNE